MAIYRVAKIHKFPVGKDRVPTLLEPGALVDIETRAEAMRLLNDGTIIRWEKSHKSVAGQPKKAVVAEARARTIRVGVFILTSRFYSGGRLHMYQMAWTLANHGAEVFIVTDGQPRWVGDYPALPGIKVVQYGAEPVPEDLDIVLTDNKSTLGLAAIEYKRRHPEALLAGMNFETPNWVAKYCPDYATRLETTAPKSTYEACDLLMANSRISGEHLLEWLGKPPGTPCVIVHPAVNSFALADAESMGWPRAAQLTRPYAVMSARSADFKNAAQAAKAILSIPTPFDLAMVGLCRAEDVKPTDDHAFHHFGMVTDQEKYNLYRHAAVVLAPSLFEGYGMVPCEALCSGTPVVVYDLPVLREEYGDRLVYAKWGDAEDFAAKVREVVALGDAGKRAVEVQTVANRKTYGMGAMSETMDALPYFAVKRTRITAQLISYWGFCPESIEAVYPHVSEIIVAFGPTPSAAKKPIDDGSLARLRAISDPEHKIKIEVRDQWKDKLEMRQWCASQATGNRMLLLDGDEVWSGLDDWLKSGIDFGCPRWVNFWHDLDHWVHDGTSKAVRWGAPVKGLGGGSVCPHYRWSWWRRTYSFRSHPVAVDCQGNALHIVNDDAARKVPACAIYHLGHALPPKVMAAKHEYYLERDGRDAGRIQRRDVWANWNGETGNCGDGVVESYVFPVPELVKRAYQGMQAWEIR